MSVQLLVMAYRQGIFPWYGPGQPVLWWCPDPRFVLRPKAAHLNHGLRREMKRPQWRVSFDEAFPEVLTACAETPRPGQVGTWITPEMQRAYLALHREGLAHSVECWLDGKLAGGLYGIALGGVFFGESMFFRVSNASKVAFARLLDRLEVWNFALVDCQQRTRHLGTFGAFDMPRTTFLGELGDALTLPGKPGSWKDLGD